MMRARVRPDRRGSSQDRIRLGIVLSRGGGGRGSAQETREIESADPVECRGEMELVNPDFEAK